MQKTMKPAARRTFLRFLLPECHVSLDDWGMRNAGRYPLAPRPITDFVFPFRRTALFGSVLLAAIVATALLSAGQARAMLLNGPATCDALFDIGKPRLCVPGDTETVLETLFTVSGNDPLFNMYATENRIILIFTDPVTGNDLNDTGFQLSGLESTVDLVSGPMAECGPGLEETHCVNFLNFQTKPSTLPFVTVDSGSGTAAIEWTRLTDMDPEIGSVAIIRLSFVPEPGTALLFGLGLAGLGVVGRSRREESEGTA